MLLFTQILIDEKEDLLLPYNKTQTSLKMTGIEGCQTYVIFILNGIQISRLLQFGDRFVTIAIKIYSITLEVLNIEKKKIVKLIF